MPRIVWSLSVLLCLAFLLYLAPGNAAAGITESTNPHSFASITDDATGGAVPWSNPSNGTACDDLRAEAALPAWSYISHRLRATNAGLAVPTTATITSIDITLEMQASGGSDAGGRFVITLLKGGSPIALEISQIISSTVDATYNFTGPASLWGTTWTPTDVNASDFGVQLYALTESAQTIAIDCLSANVYYVPAKLYYLPLLWRL